MTKRKEIKLAAINKAIAKVSLKKKIIENADISALEEQKLLIFSTYSTQSKSIKAGIIDAYTKKMKLCQVKIMEIRYQKRLVIFGKGGNAEGGTPTELEDKWDHQ